jgi:hypothetical protein
VTTYGVFVCGYKPNDLNRIDPNLYRRAIHGFAAWLKQEKGKKDGSIVEYGTYKYWEKLFGGVILAIFEDKWDENPHCTLRDAPRNFFRLVAARWSKKERPFESTTIPVSKQFSLWRTVSRGSPKRCV